MPKKLKRVEPLEDGEVVHAHNAPMRVWVRLHIIWAVEVVGIAALIAAAMIALINLAVH